MVAPQRAPGRSGSREEIPLVVVVDDEPWVLSSLRRLLRAEPYTLETTTETEEALEWVRTRKVSLILADYRMPGLCGTSVLQLVKASSPHTIRILLTDYP